jgi:hypothetical protein
MQDDGHDFINGHDEVIVKRISDTLLRLLLAFADLGEAANEDERKHARMQGQ